MEEVYAVVDSNTLEVINVVVWDGVTKWTPPEGTIIMKHPRLARKDKVERVGLELRPVALSEKQQKERGHIPGFVRGE